MKVRIVGDGTFQGTRVETIDGRMLEMVTGIEIKLDQGTRLAKVKVSFDAVPIAIDGELVEIEGEPDGDSGQPDAG